MCTDWYLGPLFCGVGQGLMEMTVFCGLTCSPEEGSSCPGHTNRVFLQECNDGCSCKWSCGNRVVQRGLSIPLQVFWTGSKGWGLRATSPIQKGSFVFEYAGEIVTNAELMQRRATAKLGKSEAFTLALDADWKSEQVVNDDVALCIDGTNLSNVSRFVNHRYEYFLCTGSLVNMSNCGYSTTEDSCM
jgi:SET domain-containing protein